ncbi:hypothetical protein FOMPIDRAFT_1027560 [Fomitopsis schrenkii]|uniref:Endonuclease/exonuclease/phosphatase domain-containing protein n=1 Tax=Fomitopsis schrenkii TaxID=2126942 RepID=S8EP64_FOMSC|nr:hypothetical protein FOMPIDRAFT_1027560 [Fomitopsis schrenkii]
MNGRGELSANPRQNKWNALHLVAKEQKIGILAIQEAHLDDTHVQRIHDMYGKRLHVINSESARGTEAEGVAFVLNRELVDTANVQAHTLIQGRALYMNIQWHGEEALTLLNVYAPNGHTQNAEFWDAIQREIHSRRLKKPNILLGDLNIVEEAVDRIPMREDASNPVQALRTLLRWLDLVDGWRISEPTTKDYTYPQRGARSCSRIDRIYTSQDLLLASNEWNISTTAVPTDHKMISAMISTPSAPFIGKGRWAMPANIMLDQEYSEHGDRLGKDDHGKRILKQY